MERKLREAADRMEMLTITGTLRIVRRSPCLVEPDHQMADGKFPGMRNREPAIDGDEHDWTSPNRRIHLYTHRPGVGRYVKRKMNRRSRRKANLAIRRDLTEQ